MEIPEWLGKAAKKWSIEFDGYRSGLLDLEELYIAGALCVLEKAKVLEEALESIAAIRASFDVMDPEQWVKELESKGDAICVIVNDTKLAHEALSQWRSQNGNGG